MISIGINLSTLKIAQRFSKVSLLAVFGPHKLFLDIERIVRILLKYLCVDINFKSSSKMLVDNLRREDHFTTFYSILGGYTSDDLE